MKIPETIDPYVVATGVMAQLLNVHPETIRLLKKKGVLKETHKGKYQLDEAVQAYLKYRDNDSALGEHAEAKLSATQERARKLKLENDRTEASLILKDDAVIIMQTMVARVKEQIMALPARVTPTLVGLSLHEMRETLRNECYSTLHRCADEIGKLADLGRSETSPDWGET